ncbi:MAG: hypothetical protein SGCHY_005251 [Lobulomycetales sp.]
MKLLLVALFCSLASCTKPFLDDDAARAMVALKGTLQTKPGNPDSAVDIFGNTIPSNFKRRKLTENKRKASTLPASESSEVNVENNPGSKLFQDTDPIVPLNAAELTGQGLPVENAKDMDYNSVLSWCNYLEYVLCDDKIGKPSKQRLPIKKRPVEIERPALVQKLKDAEDRPKDYFSDYSEANRMKKGHKSLFSPLDSASSSIEQVVKDIPDIITFREEHFDQWKMHPWYQRDLKIRQILHTEFLRRTPGRRLNMRDLAFAYSSMKREKGDRTLEEYATALEKTA